MVYSLIFKKRGSRHLENKYHSGAIFVVPALFVLTIFVALSIIMEENLKPASQYSTVSGYFFQDDPMTDDLNFDYTAVNFGLADRAYEIDKNLGSEHGLTQWERFAQEVHRLNQEAESNIQYKVLYMGRHGQGVHNVAENFYGTVAWDLHWARLDGNETVTWTDAHLTEFGVKQAEKAGSFWAIEIENQHIPVPQSYYTSPLTRCLQTSKITFGDLAFSKGLPFIPTIKELLREANGVHTCDRRSTKTYIQDKFPDYVFEAGFTERDELWNADVRESDPLLDIRMKKLLDDIFRHDRNTFISLTSHSGAIGSILRVVGHRKFNLATGSVIPVLVKVEPVPGT